MALMQCPECTKEISSSAIACPSCGYPLQKQSSEPQFEAWRKRRLIGFLILSIVCLPICIWVQRPEAVVLAVAGIAAASIKLISLRSKK
jgi:hypothetical protein